MYSQQRTVDGDHMVDAANVILKYIKELAAPPTSGRSFLVVDAYGRGVHTPSGEAYRDALVAGLRAFAQGTDVHLVYPQPQSTYPIESKVRIRRLGVRR